MTYDLFEPPPPRPERGRCPTCGRPTRNPPNEDRARKAKHTLEQALEIIRRGLPSHWHHRLEDPETSAASARNGKKFRPTQAARVLSAILRSGGAAHVHTAAELSGLSQYATSKRLSDLKNLELVYGTGEYVETCGGGGQAEIYRTNVEVPNEEA